MLQVKLLADAHSKALNVLHSCVTSYGYRASGLAAGYPQVSGRVDSAVILLGPRPRVTSSSLLPAGPPSKRSASFNPNEG